MENRLAGQKRKSQSEPRQTTLRSHTLASDSLQQGTRPAGGGCMEESDREQLEEGAGAHGGSAAAGKQGQPKERVKHGSSARLDHVRRKGQTQVDKLFGKAAELAACEAVSEWLLVAVKKDGGVLAQSSLKFDRWTRDPSGLAQVVRDVCGPQTSAEKQEILNLFDGGIRDAWRGMTRKTASALISALGVKMEIQKAFREQRVLEHMCSFLNNDYYLDLGEEREKKGEGGRIRSGWDLNSEGMREPGMFFAAGVLCKSESPAKPG